MKSITKKMTIAGLGAVCALSLSLGAGFLARNNGSAMAEANNGAPNAVTYFGDGLADADGNEYTLAKKFYKALEEMNADGDFIDGVVDYEISDIVTSEQLKGWVEDGDLEVPKAFSAARDAFLTDHPEIFYINFYKLTISVAKSGGQYVGYINCGRETNLYYDNGFNTQAKVEEAVTALETKIDEVVDYVTNLEKTNNVYNTATDAYLAKEVNAYLAERIEYSYESYEHRNDPDYVGDAYVNTPYAGLVEGIAVCGGFSTSYKVIMDRLEIPCITVNGYSKNKDEYGANSESSVYHMWNYVWLETPAATQSLSRAVSYGEWYSFDVTWNSSDYNRYRYTAMNESVDAGYHVNDGVISTSGYELVYPELSQLIYGSTGKTDGLQASIEYERTGEKDDFDNDLVNNFTIVSYNGKSAKRLYEEDGLYLAIRYASYNQVAGTEQTQLEWTDWFAFEIFRQFAVEMGGVGHVDELIQDTGTQTRYYGNTSSYYTQIAVFDVKPNRAIPNSYDDIEGFDDPTLGYDPETEGYMLWYYGNDILETTTPVELGAVMVNESYGTYTPAPHVFYDGLGTASTVLDINDSMRGNKGDSLMDANKAFVLSVKYDQPLHVLDDSKPIGISFTSIHPNTQKYAYFVKFDDGAFVHIIDDYTLQFKFCPSLMYEHNEEDYDIFFTNVGSAEVVKRKVDGQLVDQTSDKLPNNAMFSFGRAYMACPKVFNYDGRLWVECCAQPTLVSNTDLSEMNFKDENGNSTFSTYEKSQMMLVAERANTETVDTMLDGIGDIKDSNVTKNDVITSETYDIHLQMCKQRVIPDGSYVRLALGFPEGYGPNDEGVTFKIYHRKHVQGDEYIIEEIPCVVTQFGIVICTTNFSPFMVAVVNSAKVSASKTVYASVDGNGGKLSFEDGQIRSLKAGESYTYTITPDAGYSVYKVQLNGVDVTDQITADGKLTVTFEGLLNNNELQIQYVSDEAAARIAAKGVENVDPVKVIVATDGTSSIAVPSDQLAINNITIPAKAPANTVAIIIMVVFIVVAVVALAITVFVIIKRKRNYE